jgi:hypothetical protein
MVKPRTGRGGPIPVAARASFGSGSGRAPSLADLFPRAKPTVERFVKAAVALGVEIGSCNHRRERRVYGRQNPFRASRVDEPDSDSDNDTTDTLVYLLQTVKNLQGTIRC